MLIYFIIAIIVMVIAMAAMVALDYGEECNLTVFGMGCFSMLIGIFWPITVVWAIAYFGGLWIKKTYLDDLPK